MYGDGDGCLLDIMVIILQYMQIPNHYIIHLKLI